MNPDALPFDPSVIACAPTQPLFFARLPDGVLSASLGWCSSTNGATSILHLDTDSEAVDRPKQLLMGTNLPEYAEREVAQHDGTILAHYYRFDSARKAAKAVVDAEPPSLCLEQFALYDSYRDSLRQDVVQIAFDPHKNRFRVSVSRIISIPGSRLNQRVSPRARVEAQHLSDLRSVMDDLCSDIPRGGVGQLAALRGRWTGEVIRVLADNARSRVGLAPAKRSGVSVLPDASTTCPLAF